MSDDSFESESSSDGGEGIKNLRKQYEEQKKELETLRQEREQRLAAERQSKVAEILAAKGAPAGAAKFYSGEDASEGAVGKWLEDNADVFGVKAPAQPDPNAEAAARVAAASYGSPEVVSNQGNGRVIGDPEELARQIASAPYEELVRLGIMPDPKRDPYRRPVQ